MSIILFKNNATDNKKAIRQLYIFMVAKALAVCLVIYVVWSMQKVNIADNSMGYVSAYQAVGEVTAIFLSLTYIPNIMLICKNKDKT